ncbi:hypothetical protein AAG570_006057 [Ranatra chinensis]|uniref:RET cysteine rich domain-containing protein n=1 Tax=Ranatra chinensis TaxID=642074 RepID=A0ABD0XXZ5_9HEMI
MVELSAKFKLPSGVDDVEYPAGPQEIGVNAGPFTRLAQSNIALNSSTAAYKRVRFRMALPEYLQSPFNVTPAGGILYLTEWGPQALATLTSTAGVLIEWYQSDGGLVEGVHWISVDVVPPRGGCPVQGPAQLRGWALCHERSRNTTCLNTCGLAVHPSRNGKCQWRKGSNMAGILTTNYSTCTSDVDHCPDGVCDPLEDINRHICPQDCTRTVIMGTSNPKTLRGIYSGVGVCTCDTVGKCHCGPPELPPPQRQRKTTSLPTTSPTNPTSLNNTRGPHVRAAGNERCDASCMVMLITSGVCITLLIAGSIFYFSSRSGWIKKKQTVIESSAYSTDALLPLPSTEVNQQQTEPQPVIEMDPKWEIPRSRIIIESCLGEGEFGKVLKASAKDLPSHPGRKSEIF